MLNKTHAMIKKQYKQYSSKVICFIRRMAWLKNSIQAISLTLTDSKDFSGSDKGGLSQHDFSVSITSRTWLTSQNIQ